MPKELGLAVRSGNLGKALLLSIWRWTWINPKSVISEIVNQGKSIENFSKANRRGSPDGQAPGDHFELDFEFLGTNGTVQTNVYDNDGGHREQSFKLWFLVDNIPIRVFKNLSDSGIPYPTRPMHIEASIWDADWAGAVDWSEAPFTAEYQDFGFWACSGDTSACASEQYFWNRRGYWDLNDRQKSTMEMYRRSYMSYDYCGNPSTSKPECSINA
ncbi:Xyloglucan endotransglucosylase/hydrolase protein 3 [Striga hermonthica]|uniref:Xyloglucan endotransglucosylase/hydrolase protein 3 n=1 Tax=Striga hermonthica TaxID=68872 RepID=A0A9N7R6S4_STRHE|nr:Xyloglucan endotransglucosylase/hydrolase protein 3 [Striga hermonthica]